MRCMLMLGGSGGMPSQENFEKGPLILNLRAFQDHSHACYAIAIVIVLGYAC